MKSIQPILKLGGESILLDNAELAVKQQIRFGTWRHGEFLEWVGEVSAVRPIDTLPHPVRDRDSFTHISGKKRRQTGNDPI
jgi:hypothetical protein